MEASEYPEVSRGEGYAVGNLDALGDGPGFRKVRKGLDVGAFGVNAIVMPPGIESGFHFHDEQEELYFVHRGTIEMEFGDGTIHAFNQWNGHLDGTLRDTRGDPLVIDGPWGLLPGNGTAAPADAVWFSAGPDGEAHGLLGTLTAG